MPAPATAFVWKPVMDPTDRVEWGIDLATGVPPMLEPGEVIASYTLVMYPESVAKGLEISAAPYISGIMTGNTTLKFWFEINDTFKNDPIFATGMDMPMELTVVTTSTPPRRRQRTVVLRVAQR